MDEQKSFNYEVTARPIEPINNLVGFASIKIHDCFVVDGFKIYNGENGLFASMPSKVDKKSDTGYRDTVKPITAEFHKELNEAITMAYREALEKKQNRDTPGIGAEMAKGAKQAAKDNADRPTPTKGKDKGDR